MSKESNPAPERNIPHLTTISDTLGEIYTFEHKKLFTGVMQLYSPKDLSEIETAFQMHLQYVNNMRKHFYAIQDYLDMIRSICVSSSCPIVRWAGGKLMLSIITELSHTHAIIEDMLIDCIGVGNHIYAPFQHTELWVEEDCLTLPEILNWRNQCEIVPKSTCSYDIHNIASDLDCHRKCLDEHIVMAHTSLHIIYRLLDSATTVSNCTYHIESSDAVRLFQRYRKQWSDLLDFLMRTIGMINALLDSDNIATLTGVSLRETVELF